MSNRKAARAYGSSSRVRASLSSSSAVPMVVQSRAPLGPKTNVQNSGGIGAAEKGDDAASDAASTVKADPKKSSHALSLMMSPVLGSDESEDDEMETENIGEFRLGGRLG